jgi:hypothetical protein
MPGKALCKASEPDGLALFGLDLFPQILPPERSARHFHQLDCAVRLTNEAFTLCEPAIFQKTKLD